MSIPGPALLLSLVALAAGAASGAPRLTYSSLEAEAAAEYQPGWNRFGPGFVKLIGKAEVALTDELALKAAVSPCAGPYSTEPEGVTQCAPYRVLEELTISGVGKGFDFSVGRQIVTQGNTEGFVLLDRFNGRDLCRFARLDVQNKLPNWIARGRAFAGAATLSVTLAPYSAESEIPDPASYCADTFNNPGQFDYLSDPRNANTAGWAGGVELAVTHDWWGATLDVMSTREDLFVLQTVPGLQKTLPRTLWLGGTASATLGGIVVRGEVAYAPNRTFTIAPAATAGLLMRGIGTDGTDERWNLLTVVGIEAQHGDWYGVLQYFDNRVEAGPALALGGESQMMSLRIRRSFANDRIAFDAFAILDLDYHDAALRASLSYEIAANTRIEVGGTTYADIGHTTGFFGSYVGRDSLYAKVIRAF